MSSIFVGKAENYDFLSLLNIPINLDYHNHPLLFCFTLDRAKHGTDWSCNKCFLKYTYDTPSFYCTVCDFDLCQNCVGKYRPNQIQIYKHDMNYSQEESNNVFQWQTIFPKHIHLLTKIQKRNINNPNYTWKCNDCSNSFINNYLSFYCSLCDYFICQNCINKN